MMRCDKTGLKKPRSFRVVWRRLSRCSAPKGFTLIETLLAVTLFAIVMSASYGIFSMGIQIWHRTTAESVAERQALLAVERFGQDLRGLVPNSLEDFRGSGSDKMMVIPSLIPADDSQGRSKLQYGRVIYEWDGGRKTLCLKKVSASDLYRNATPDCRIIAESVKSFGLRYLTYEGIGEAFSWYDRWDGEDGIPAAVRVSMVVEPPARPGQSLPSRTIEKTLMVPAGRR